jgi:hypothetical protein
MAFFRIDSDQKITWPKKMKLNLNSVKEFILDYLDKTFDYLMYLNIIISIEKNMNKT